MFDWLVIMLIQNLLALTDAFQTTDKLFVSVQLTEIAGLQFLAGIQQAI